MPENPFIIEVDGARRCRSCGRRGACGNGLCLPCNTARMMAARRVAADLRTARRASGVCVVCGRVAVDTAAGFDTCPTCARAV